jgi:hypothetical protein
MSLPDLSKVFAEQFETIVASGAIQNMIAEQLKKTVDTVLKSQIESYSEFGNALKEKVKAALLIDDLRDLPNYGHFISGIIAKNVDQQLHGAYAAKLAEDIQTLFKDAPAEYTLEQLIEDFKKHITGRMFREHDHRMTLRLKEWDCGGFVVEMDQSANADRFSCDLSFQVNKEGEIFALKLKKSDVSKDLFIGGLDAFERAIFRMYVQGTKLVIEPGTTESDFSLYYGDDD